MWPTGIASPAATVLILLAAVSSYVSAQSGTAAHGPVERAPGAPGCHRARRMGRAHGDGLLVLGAVELLSVALRRWPKVGIVRWTSAVVGVAAVASVYQTARLGGELVYADAGGVGIRSGDPHDVDGCCWPAIITRPWQLERPGVSTKLRI